MDEESNTASAPIPQTPNGFNTASNIRFSLWNRLAGERSRAKVRSGITSAPLILPPRAPSAPPADPTHEAADQSPPPGTSEPPPDSPADLPPAPPPHRPAESSHIPPGSAEPSASPPGSPSASSPPSPSITRSHTARVASGVTSRAASPVPPVVTIKSRSNREPPQRLFDRRLLIRQHIHASLTQPRLTQRGGNHWPRPIHLRPRRAPVADRQHHRPNRRLPIPAHRPIVRCNITGPHPRPIAGTARTAKKMRR